MPALLALGAAAVFGVADFVGGRATARTPVTTVTLVSNIVGGVLACLLAIVATTWSIEAILWGSVGGTAGLAGLLLLYHGLATGPNRLVSPVSAVVAAVVPVAVGVATGERPPLVAIAGLLITPIAVWLIADGAWQLADRRRSLTIAIGAGLGFGTFFACLAQTPDDAGAAPLVAARAASVTILLAITLGRRQAIGTNRRAVGIAAAAGVLDMTANGLFLWAVQDGNLAITGALVSLFPATTLGLAVVVLHERIHRRQIVGIATALLAAALLS